MASDMKSLGKLVLCLILCLGIGFVSSIFSNAPVTTWYPSLNKPPGTLPTAVFAPVWIILYVMMAVSLWWANIANAPKHAYSIFFVQLLLNLFWSFLFFGMQSTFLGLLDILILDAAVAGTILVFWEVSKGAAMLLVPYMLWILYATYLNFALFIINR